MAGRGDAASEPLSAGEMARLAGRALCVTVLSIVALVLILGCRGLGSFRGGVRGCVGLHVVQVWARAVLPLLGLKVVQVGQPAGEACALVANHAGWLDIVVLMRAARLSFVAKEEVRGWPAIGAIARTIGTIFIVRRPRDAGRQRDLLRERLAQGDRVAFFPEGTSTDGLRVLPFKSSLFDVFFEPQLRERVRVQPVTIVYRAPAGAPARFYGWWGDMDLLPSLREVLARSVGGVVEVIFHEAMRVQDFPDRKAMAKHAERTVRAALEVRLGAPLAAVSTLGKEDQGRCAGGT